MPTMVKNDVNVNINNNNNIDCDSTLEKKDNQQKVIKCSQCGEIKGSIFFYPCYSPNNKTGYTYICKDCCEEFSLDDGVFTKDGAYRLCKLIDKPYKEKYYAYCQNKKFKTEKAKIGAYIQVSNYNRGKAKEEGFDCSEQVNYLEDYDKSSEEIEKEDKIRKKLFGIGYTDDEYEWLYNKYSMLTNNYPIRTEMHKEMLVKYCKYALREDQAIANNDTNSAKYWGDLASKTAVNAKINPNQLSVADLSDGLDCFSQLSMAVEKAGDIIEYLPKYLKQPLDRVDYIIYMLLDYLRDLEGKPHINYEDVYKWINDRAKENTKKFGKNVVPQDEKEIDKNAILVMGEREED